MSAGPNSRAWMARAERVIPGGVSSPVRAYRAVGGTPLVFRSASGAEIEDVDGRRYIDFVNSWGPLILGHAHPEVREAIVAAVGRGTTFGAPGETEIELAEKIVAWYPGLEQVRFVSSGTEATMSAIRVARGAHEARQDREVRRLLSRSRRPPAGVGGFGARHLRRAVVGRRAGGLLARDAGAPAR